MGRHTDFSSVSCEAAILYNDRDTKHNFLERDPWTVMDYFLKVDLVGIDDRAEIIIIWIGHILLAAILARPPRKLADLYWTVFK